MVPGRSPSPRRPPPPARAWPRPSWPGEMGSRPRPLKSPPATEGTCLQPTPRQRDRGQARSGWCGAPRRELAGDAHAGRIRLGSSFARGPVPRESTYKRWPSRWAWRGAKPSPVVIRLITNNSAAPRATPTMCSHTGKCLACAHRPPCLQSPSFLLHHSFC